MTDDKRGTIPEPVPEPMTGPTARPASTPKAADVPPATWQARYRAATRECAEQEVLATHPEAARLEDDFSIGGYLGNNVDVACAAASPGEAAFHYLEIGHGEGRNARAPGWDPAFVRAFHGIDLPGRLSPAQAATRLRLAGIAPVDILLSETHLWCCLGLDGAFFATVFEHETYLVMAQAKGVAIPARDRISAIGHFCEMGLDLGVPPHPAHRFDPAFYRAALKHAEARVPPPAALDDATLRRHWAEKGTRHGLHANTRASFRMMTGVALPMGVVQAFPEYIAAADLGVEPGTPRVLAHLAETPLPGAAVFDAESAEVQSFVLDLAEYRRRKGDDDGAEGLIALVLAAEPGHARAHRDLADILADRMTARASAEPDAVGGRKAGKALRALMSAEVTHRRAVPERFDDGSNTLALAERLLALDEPEDALDVVAALPGCVDGIVPLRDRRTALAHDLFTALWSDLTSAIAQHGVTGTQALLQRALEFATPSFDTPPRPLSIRRVAILSNNDLPQCTLYRVEQKAEQLRAAGYDVQCFAAGRDEAHLQAQLDRFDAIIFMRLPAFPPIIDLIAAAACRGLATFYEIDDLIFDPAQFPPPLETYAGSITEGAHGHMACGVVLFRHAMTLCDYGIASTRTLQEQMEPLVRRHRVFLHRNGLGSAHLHVAARLADHPPVARDKTVLFYGSGTRAHKAAFHRVLEPALAHVLERCGDSVEVRLVGEFGPFRWLNQQDPRVQVIAPMSDFETYLGYLHEADINLSVLERSTVTDAKSEIKWLEAAMLGIPSVVSDTTTHREVIVDGETGFLCGDADAFADAMLRLITDPALRDIMGQAAKARAEARYCPAVLSEALDRSLSDLSRSSTEAARKARLVIVNVYYPPQDIGGATRVVQDNVRDLLRKYGDRYEIDVISTLAGGDVPYEVGCHSRDGARVWTITPGRGVGVMEVTDTAMGATFGDLLDRIAPDLVHFHCVQHLTARVVDVTRRRGLPYVITLHDGWWLSPNQFIASATGRLECYDFSGPERQLPVRAQVTRRCLEDAAAVVAVSEPFAALHREAGLGMVESLANGLSSLPDVTRLPSPEGRVRLGHIGGASRHKGFALLRAAMESRRYENLELTVRDYALPLCAVGHEMWNTVPVTFLPRVPLDRVGEVYGALDVVVAPSVWPESFGLVTREAAALGLWVVASDRGAIGADVIEGETGHIVDISDHEALADCLSAIDADPGRYRQPPSRRGIFRCAEAQADELANLYARVLGQAKP